MSTPTEYRTLHKENVYTMKVHGVMEGVRNFPKQGTTYYCHIITFTDGEFLYKTEYPTQKTTQDVFRTDNYAQFEVTYQKNFGLTTEVNEIEPRGNPADWNKLEETKKQFVYRPMKGESYEIALGQAVYFFGQFVTTKMSSKISSVDILTMADEFDLWLKAKQETQNKSK